MSTPNVPLRLELTVEVTGTPEQVWQAIATAGGISAWFAPTEMEGREGGPITFHMGEMDSTGRITGWEPPGRFAYEEDWAGLVGQEGAPVTPLVTEFLVEAKSGGTCVVRVVSSAFGTGDTWEQEFFDQMEKAWTPFFQHLQLYMAHFPGQTATTLAAEVDVKGSSDAVCAAMRENLGLYDNVPDAASIRVRGLVGQVERTDGPQVLLRLEDPIPGYVAFFAFDKGDGIAAAVLAGYLFSDAAPAYVQREQTGWKDWLQNLSAPTA
jgi:uncharacterized protein YndB with AHSA1/START domain